MKIKGNVISGIVFHESRCGSTLASNMLAAVPGTRVFSEPGILSYVFPFSKVVLSFLLFLFILLCSVAIAAEIKVLSRRHIHTLFFSFPLSLSLSVSLFPSFSFFLSPPLSLAPALSLSTHTFADVRARVHVRGFVGGCLYVGAGALT